MDAAELRSRFAYHPPTTEIIADAHTAVREVMSNAAEFFNNMLPEGREKSVVITKLEEAMMWANASIARNQQAT